MTYRMNSNMKIVADRAIPFLQGVFEPWAEVVYKDGREICREDLTDATVLITRTITKCNEALLEGTPVKMIASATIGVDHIDRDYCAERDILVCNAPGCNAGGVMEYVFSALYGVASRKAVSLKGRTMGIIGVGHVGKRVEEMAVSLGFKVRRYDPPREAAEGHFGYCSLEELLKGSDIVTLHVPLTPQTRNMADASFFAKMKKGAFFINTSRGEVVDEDALIAARPRLGTIIIDTWKNEPNINKELLELADIATPHIAGYSYQGKQNGTAAVVRAVAHYFGITELYEFFPKAELPENEAAKIDIIGKNQGEIASLLQYNYPIFTDDFMLRLSPDDFDRLRSKYSYRREIYI